MSPLLRPVGPFDLELVATLHGASFEEAWGVQAIAEIMAMPGAFGLIVSEAAEAGPRPAGFLLARLAAEDCEILSIGVSPGRRRRGLARTLMAEATQLASAAGARRVFLEVAEDNWAARRLYAALGFAPVGRRRNYYRRGQDFVAALTMRRLVS
ncbi:MAG TPA: GNAT family N-acetyltransferase [Methylomirabilota bacterium]|jgi:[ribosomal protein S18]-alanine N-acetyltransferase|nr:GNAT family N-acetyltransferase [Methylomirabilota bacterium]